MTPIKLKVEIENILGKADTWAFRVRQDGTLVIEYGCMGAAPKLNLSRLIKLSLLFGTEEIDVDDYAKEGCETCDYGSDYGHEIQIYSATKCVKDFVALSKVK
jgi:hypothetical protein